MNNIIHIPLHNSELQHLSNRIRSREEDIAYYRRIIANDHATIRDLREGYFDRKRRLLKLYQLEKAPNAELIDECFDIKTAIHRTRSGIIDTRNSLAYFRNNIRSYLQGMDRVTQEKASLQQQYARLRVQAENDGKKIDRHVLRDQLQSIPNVTNVRITNRESSVSIAVVFEGLTMSCMPDQEGLLCYILATLAERLNAPRLLEINPAEIPLEPMRITLTISKHNIQNSHFRATNLISEDRTVQPHWLSSANPCFGDFEYSIYEMVRQLDIHAAFMLVHLYLTTYNAHDSAGASGLVWGLLANPTERELAQRVLYQGTPYSTWLEEFHNEQRNQATTTTIEEGAF